MVTALSDEAEAVTLEDSDQLLIVDGSDLWQSESHRHPVSDNEFRRFPAVTVAVITGLFEQAAKCAKLFRGF